MYRSIRLKISKAHINDITDTSRSKDNLFDNSFFTDTNKYVSTGLSVIIRVMRIYNFHTRL